jgi:hypothetical protein
MLHRHEDRPGERQAEQPDEGTQGLRMIGAQQPQCRVVADRIAAHLEHAVRG